MQLKGFGMRLAERFGVVYDEGEIATAAGTGHFPCEHVGHGAVVGNGGCHIAVILFGMTNIGRFNHAGKHGHLGFERSFVSRSEIGQVVGDDGLPASIGRIGKRLYLGGRNIFFFHHRTTGFAGFHGQHHQMFFQKAKRHFVVGAFYLGGPEVVVVIMSAKTRHTNTDGILGTGDMSVGTLGIIFETEHQTGQHFRIHLGKLHGPNFLYHAASAGTQTTTVAHLESRFQRNGDGPAGMMHAYVRLVYPSTGQV